MKIAFIIVTYKTPKKDILRLKKEIISLKFIDYKIYIIDNTLDNKGYGAGVNRGIKRALTESCGLFVLMNPDISIKTLKKEDFMKADKYFDIYGFSFRQQEVMRYGGKNDPWRMSGGLIEKKPKKRFIRVDFVSGSLMVVKLKVINKIGLFDEDYFMYYEDNDYCERARRAGLRVGIDSHISYEHFETSARSTSKEKHLSSSRWRFFLKFSSFRQKLYELIRLPKTLVEKI